MAPKIKFDFVPVVDLDSLKHNAQQVQQLFSRLKLAPNLSEDLEKEIGSLFKAIESHEKNLSKSSSGLINAAQLQKSGKEVERIFTNIRKGFGKISRQDIQNSFDIDTSEIKELEKSLNNIKSTIFEQSGITEMFSQLQEELRGTGVSASVMINQLKNMDVGTIFEAGNIDGTYDKLLEIFKKIQSSAKGAQTNIQKFNKAMSENQPGTTEYEKAAKGLERMTRNSNQYKIALDILGPLLKTIETKQGEVTAATKETEQAIYNLREKELDKLNDELGQNQEAMKKTGEEMEKVNDSFYNTASAADKLNRDLSNVIDRVTDFATLSGQIAIFSKVVRAAYEDVKELDKVMNSIATVSEFTTAQMWEQSNSYAKMASQMGTTILGAYEVAKLYYQQGRSTAEVTDLTAETLKLARLAELDYADATDYMTVALNGYNMATEQAAHVTDVYSKLSSKAAVDQAEIAIAMSKTASLAASTGMSFENTSAFLSLIIEKTREAPETAGTA